MLEVKGLTVKYGSLTIVDGLSFTLAEHEWLMIAGPNGAGKSTAIGAIAQSVPHTGQVLFEGREVADMKPGEVAKRMGMLSQNHYVGYSFSVEEVVRLGRYAYSKGLFSSSNDGDGEQIERALEMTGMSALRSQSVLTLSGGELQRTFLAQVFAQDPQILLLDEPTNHLDLVYQKQVFGLIRSWMDETGRSVISVVHDLSLAKSYGTSAVLMEHGKSVAQGAVDEVLTPEHLDPVYRMDVAEWMRALYGQWK